jgi:periplasmic divalent cation tolerance protein
MARPLDFGLKKGSALTMQPQFFVVLVTAPTLAVGRKLARAALEARLVACVNLVPRIESHYWWEGRLESSREVLLILKTTRARLKSLEQLVEREHPYDTPECIALSITRGSERYLDWIQASQT